MDFGKILQDQLSNMGDDAKKPKKSSKKSTQTKNSGGLLDDVLDKAEDALNSKLPDNPITDIAKDALDQNKDSRVVDDLFKMGENLLRKKK